MTEADRNAPVELRVRVLHGTADAWLVEDGAGAQAWLPRQHVAFPGGRAAMGWGTITVPAWLAEEKGLTPGAAPATQGRLEL